MIPLWGMYCSFFFCLFRIPSRPMKPFLAYIIPAFTALLLSGCSGSKEFRLDAASDDIGTQNVTLIYYTDGSYRVEIVSALDGKFSVTGKLSSPAYVEIFTGNGSPLGEFIVEGGDHIEARFSALNPENISIKGNDDAELLTGFLEENRPLIKKGDDDGLNRAVEKFIRENPRQFASTVLLTRYFSVEGYENLALELIQLIPEKYRPEDFTQGFEQMLDTSLAADTLAIKEIRAYSTGDSIFSFTPAGAKINLLMLTDNDSRSSDSIKEMLSALRAGTPSQSVLRVTDFGCDRDTLLWHSSMRSLPDDYPAGVTRLWLNAGMATEGISQGAPTTLPYFMMTDSTGRLLYRSPSASATRAAFGHLRKNL